MTSAITYPPAKLNLFLELRSKRKDGFHEIDTVMVPIDWCDRMRVTRSTEHGVRLAVRWSPSREVIARQLGIDTNSPMLDVPEGPENLVHRALTRFQQKWSIEGGFDCQLDKRIPAGAGLGGASSDAAGALRCAAALCGIPPQSGTLYGLAAEIGSDVPFFLGSPEQAHSRACRARGRGERLTDIPIGTTIDLVVVYPAVSLSTAKVYADSQVPLNPLNATALIDLLKRGRIAGLDRAMVNRLTNPAKKLAPQIEEVLESISQVGLKSCQLTGSGSACFALAGSRREALRCCEQLRGRLEPGAIVMPARMSNVPAWVDLN